MRIKLIFLLITSSTLLTSLCMLKKEKSIKKLPKEFREQFAYISFGSFTLEAEFSDYVIGCDIDTSRLVTLNSFYCAISEVTNLQYREFLDSIEDDTLLNVAEIDSVQWRSKAEYNEPYVELYHRHPAYNNYPVVNVPHTGAKMYCEWLEKTLNSEGQDKFIYTVNLPSREQWVLAAKGNFDLCPYPWGTSSVRNSKGCFLANFENYGAENIHFNSKTQTYEVLNEGWYSPSMNYRQPECGVSEYDITTPSISYSANAYGIYNMSGNVAEMVLEEGTACGGGWRSTGFDIRCVSTMSYSGPQPDIGFRPVITIKEKQEE